MASTECVGIIDRNPIFRISVREIISARLPEVIVKEALSFRVAREFLWRTNRVVLFLDIDADIQKCLAFIREIDTNPNIFSIIVAYSINDNPEYRQAVLNSGADHYFCKSDLNGKQIIQICMAHLKGLLNERHPPS